MPVARGRGNLNAGGYWLTRQSASNDWGQIVNYGTKGGSPGGATTGHAAYLGSTLQEAQVNVATAAQKIGVGRVTPEIGGLDPNVSTGEAITAGLAFLGGGLATLDAAALSRLSSAARTGGGAAAGAAARNPLKTAVGGALIAGAVSNIGSTLDFLKFIAQIFHPGNILRAVEFLVGLGTMFYGLHLLIGNARRSSSTHRGGVMRSLFNMTPIGREASFARARSRGKRAGQTQAERDVAYRQARQDRARSVGAEKRRPLNTGGEGGTGGMGA